MNPVNHHKNGKQEGLGTLWYKSGEKKCEIHFKNGKEEGLMTSWYESGMSLETRNLKSFTRMGN